MRFTYFMFSVVASSMLMFASNCGSVSLAETENGLGGEKLSGKELSGEKLSGKELNENDLAGLVNKTLAIAGDNRPQLQSALDQIEDNYRPGMNFLLAYMPPSDAQALTAEFLLEHVRIAYEAWEKSPWHDMVHEDIFLNNLLPYASVSERREAWRKDFRERFLPWVNNAKSAGEAAVILNQKVFGEVGVKYSTKRKRADQGPYESMEGGTASCTGLSILLIDACRAVGVPARFVGVPRWSDNSGNHSWVEVWDGDQWKFTGAAEPAGDELNKGWFTGRVSDAKRDEPMYAVYAVSYRKTPLKFPLVWQRNFDPVWSVNVTDRYTQTKPELPPNQVLGRFRVIDALTKNRVSATILIETSDGEVVFYGISKDESFDGNDHLNAPLEKNTKFNVTYVFDGNSLESEIATGEEAALFTLNLEPSGNRSSQTIDHLKNFLAEHSVLGESFFDQPFVRDPLSKAEANEAVDLLWEHRRQQLSDGRKEEMANKLIKIDDLEMKYEFTTFGDKPESGHALFISMHGGGGAPARVNEQQWKNQIKLYEPNEGIYLAPRAPTNTWNLWHQAHIDKFFDRIIENFVLAGEVDPNRIYLMGYSAGGDGVYQLAPRMADRFAAASMMAGHPNETQPLGLRNIPFALYMGGKDKAYNRNEIAAQWKEKLKSLQDSDPDGYDHLVTIYPEKGHWMDREDASALEWMSNKTRRAWPKKIVWLQDDVTHERFYWLSVKSESAKPGSTIVAQIDGQILSVQTKDVEEFRIWLHDDLVDVEKDLELIVNGNTQILRTSRTIEAIVKSLNTRVDRELIAFAFIDGSIASKLKE